MASQKHSSKKKLKTSSQPEPPQPKPLLLRHPPSSSSPDEVPLEYEIRPSVNNKTLPFQRHQEDEEEAFDYETETEDSSEEEGSSDGDEPPVDLTRSDAAHGKKPLVATSSQKQHRPSKQTSSSSRPAVDATKQQHDNNEKKKRKLAVEDPAPAAKKQQVDASPSFDGKAAGKEKKALFERLWSTEDQLKLLNQVSAYKTQNGRDPPNATLSDFKGFEIDFTADQIKSKLSSLKRRYRKKTLSDASLHEAASKIWGGIKDLKRVKLEAVELAGEDNSLANKIADFLAKCSLTDHCAVDLHAMFTSIFASLSHPNKEKIKTIWEKLQTSIIQFQMDHLKQLKRHQIDAAEKMMKIMKGDSD